MNSLYDPDYTGVGGTPSGVSTYLGADKPFFRYRVDSADVEVRCFNTSASGYILVGMLTGSDSVATGPATGALAQQTMLEGRAAAWDCLNSTTGVEHSTCVLKRHFNMKDVIGVHYKDRDCTAAYSASPAVAAYMILMMSNADGGGFASTAQFVVRITYHVSLSERLSGVVD